ncbi:MAG: phosphoenolpyruvate carboxykinase (ATP), partial [Acidimicrobiia bacterium]
MKTTVARESGLEGLGLKPAGAVYWNRSAGALYEEAVRRREGLIAASGPLVCSTVPHTGRSPNDKFIVREPSSEKEIWWGKVNRDIPASSFEALLQLVTRHLSQVDLFVQDCYAGADPAYRVSIRVITEKAWHSLFARHLFITEPDGRAPIGFAPDFTIMSAPKVHADPAVHGTASETFIIINFQRKIVLIGGTSYAGEIKKSVFTLLNYLLPGRQVMPMHCSANIGAEGDTALFFGLSGTGKTTLSSDPTRRLIGDDEHGWSERGIFNFEGGCYAKVIRLSREAEPQIYQTTQRFGTVLENVAIDPDFRVLDLNDDSVTENTRGAYPIFFIANAELSGMGPHPQNLFMLTADAFGVLPPIARLTSAQAMYHFLSGYT